MITTASDRIVADFRSNRLLQGLAAAFIVIFIAGAIDPVDRFDWWLENLLLFLAVALLGWFYRARPLSDFSYILITVFLALHTIGAHYTYARVPFGFWLQDAMALDRNHFDRISHFAFGLLIVYPVREVLVRFARAGLGLSAFTAFTVMATSGIVFEIIEWIIAVIVNPDAAMAYLGTQGDGFDPVKDAAMEIVGAVTGLALTRRHFTPQDRLTFN